MTEATREYLDNQSNKKICFGAVKLIVGGFVALANPVAGTMMIANGVNNFAEAKKLAEASRE